MEGEGVVVVVDDDGAASSEVRPVPGSYGLPYVSAVRDRLDYFYFQGRDKYFQSRADRYRSTVVRLNVPPGPFIAGDSRVVALLDAKSFPVLFDVTKVDKTDVFTGTYMPSTSLTGGHRVCAYRDASDPAHATLKRLLFSLLADRKHAVIPAFRANFSALLATVESELKRAGASSFNNLNNDTSFDFIGEAYLGVRPSATALGTTGPYRAAKWLLWQLHPLITVGLPMAIEDPLLHAFPLPPFLVARDYKALYDYFSGAAPKRLLDTAAGLGLSREETCHNLLFATVFNSYAGLVVVLPTILSLVASAGEKLHARLAAEIRAAVGEDDDGDGKVTVAAVEKMELTKSVVWEALRLDPPVKFQYARAKADLRIESHDGAAYGVKKGEMLFGYQPFATKDPRVFGATAAEFVGDRFVGEEGRKLLKYVYWSNGPETETPAVDNKQCPGRDMVLLVARLLLVELFLRYDTFTADVGTDRVGSPTAVFTSITKRRAT